MPTTLVYHYTIEDVGGGNKTGFMAAKDKNGHRVISIEDAQTIQGRVLTMGDLTESESPPELRLYWTQKDWRAGIGGVRSSEPRTLATSRYIDASETGKLRPARKFAVSTLDVSATQGTPSGFAIVENAELWAFIGREPYSWDETGNEWDKGTAPAASDVIYKNGVVFGVNTYAPCWTRSNLLPNRYIYKQDSDANWLLIASGSPTDAFKYFGKTRNQNDEEIMVGGFTSSGVHHIHTTTDPTAPGNWSAATAVGNSDAEITGLLTGPNNEIIICKSNGIWTLTPSGTVRNLAPEYEPVPHPDNFKGAFNWNGHILLPLGFGGMVDFFNGQLYDVSFRLFGAELTEFHGTVAAITGSPSKLFVLIYDKPALTYHVLMAERVALDETPEDFRWHHVLSDTIDCGASITEVSAAFMEGIELSGGEIHRRAWFAFYDTTGSTTPLFFPLEGDDQDGYSSPTGILAQTTKDSRGFRRVDKTFLEINFETENLGASGRLWTISYRIDGGNFTTDLADAAGNADGVVDVSPSQTMKFPNGTTGKEIDFKFVPAVTGTQDLPPVISEFRLVTSLRPDQLDLVPITFYLADKLRLKNGTYDTNLKAAMAQLRTWDAQAAEVLVKYDEGDGSGETTKNMVFLPGKMKFQRVRAAPWKRPEWVVTSVLAEV